MKKQIAALLLVIALAFASGCGTTAKAKAREDMEKSKAAYENCLRQYPDDPSRCEPLRRAYEADYETYREAVKATGPTVTGFIEFGPGGSGK